MSESIFENWKERCSQLGHLTTNLEGITVKQLEDLNALLERQEEAKTEPKKALTQNMKDKLKLLIEKRDKPDELPAGAITHLESVFRDVFWKRRRLLNNKYLDKGNICEEDAVRILGIVNGTIYFKNKTRLVNDFITGMADVVTDVIDDTKCSYDMDSFDNSELSHLYQWQIKGYCFGYGKTEGSVDHCLVNNPIHQLESAKNSLWYNLGQPDKSETRWIEAVQQLERNMIFDIAEFKKSYPNYVFENTVLDFDIPAVARVKKFKVTLDEGDIEDIIRRVKLARKWLVNKEKETLEILKKQSA